MHRFELFQVRSIEDHSDAEAEGLAAQYEDACSSCEEPVGLVSGELFDYVIVSDENEDFWFTCDACATPVTDPEA